MKYCLAIDIGASSGRHILGSFKNGKICLEEVYRFENYLVNEGDSLVWDIDNLVKSVKAGIKKCGEIGKIPETVAIDTWGVDYLLLDENKNEILPAYGYRDGRTIKAAEDAEKIVPIDFLYERCGIPKLNFNTVYQLYADKVSGRLDKAKYFMMMPAYLSYKLTGVIKNEYTEASTSGMVNAKTFQWDSEILEKLGVSAELLGTLSNPGDEVGSFTEEMKSYAGFNAKVIFCPSHDTASAVAACPVCDNDIYISSGTWSLIGTEIKTAVLSKEAREANFANEGGIEKRFRFLKNYMGMWLFQNIRKNLNKSMTYDEMMNLAIESGKYSYIDVNAQEFVAPENMIDAIRKYLGNEDMPLGEVINSVYHSLAKSYKSAIEEVERLSGIKANAIRIVGGGSKDKYLNRLTAEYTGKKVYAGPVECTALGNIISQLMASEGYTLSEMREAVMKSFDIEEVK